MRQYAGFGSATQTNERFRYLLGRARPGCRWRSICRRRWATTAITRWRAAKSGSVGVAISCLADMEALLAELPLDRVTTSMTINATAPLLLAFYVAVADARGIPRANARRHGAERRAQGVHRARHVHLSARGLAAAHHRRVRVHRRARCRSGTASRCRGYHMREAGSTAVQELAFTLAQRARLSRGRARARARRRSRSRGACRSSSTRTITCSRRWRSSARRASCGPSCCSERFGAAPTPRPLKLRFHTQTAGSMLTAQQPLNNVVRVTRAGRWRRCSGGTQSLHTNSLRRGARPADRGLGAAGAAHAAGARARERRDGRRRSARGLATWSSRSPPSSRPTRAR